MNNNQLPQELPSQFKIGDRVRRTKLNGRPLDNYRDHFRGTVVNITKTGGISVKWDNDVSMLRKKSSLNPENLELIAKESPVKIGAKVAHVKEVDVPGKIIQIDWNLLELGYDTTTCEVLWEDFPILDVQ